MSTPSAIWSDGKVIFDEISRCPPDIQNKLFSIIHERKAQELPTESLIYRWPAMNPPAGKENEEAEYRGSEPIDPALADRLNPHSAASGLAAPERKRAQGGDQARDDDASRSERKPWGRRVRL